MERFRMFIPITSFEQRSSKGRISLLPSMMKEQLIQRPAKIIRILSSFSMRGALRELESTKIAMSPVYRFDDYQLEPAERRLLRGDQEILLRPKSFEVLICLIERGGRVVHKDELLDHVWPETHVVESVLVQCVAEIRSALNEDTHEPRYIKTIPKLGYRWIAKVEHVSGPGEVREPLSASDPRPSIAVLPFKDMSSHGDHDYFCEGIAEEIINALVRVGNLHVVARTSSFSFRNRNLDIRSIGHTLKVETVLEGSLRKSGDRLRIAVQLISVEDGFHLWSEQFECETGDVFNIQDQITKQIIEKLKIELLGEEEAARVRRSTENPEAYVLNLKGRYLMYRATVEGLNRAIQYCKEAIEKDPDYAHAYAGLATCYSSLGFWNAVPPPQAYLEAKKAAVRAVETDPESALAHEALGFVTLLSDWDWKTAAKASQRAIDLNPREETIRVGRAMCYIATGDLKEALAETVRATGLAPLSNVANSGLGLCLLRLGKLEEAIVQLKKALELEPADPRTRLYLGLAYVLKLRFDEGIGEIREAFEQASDNRLVLAGLGWAYGMAGRRTEALRTLERIKRRFEQEHPRPYLIAKVYCGMGEKDLAFEWLDRAFAEHDTSLTFVRTDESLAALSDDPRFTGLLRRMNLITRDTAPQ